MTKIVLTADPTLMSEFRGLPLGGFLGCVSPSHVPQILYKFLSKLEPPLNGKGIARFAPYGLRKVEAALLKNGFDRRDVVVVHPDYIQNFLDEDTIIVAHGTMDPYGLGPVTMMFTLGRRYMSYDELEFRRFITKLNVIRKRRGLKFKIIVGGPGAWQLEYMLDESRRLGIDHIIIGEVEHVINDVFEQVALNDAPEIIRVTTFPSPNEIPPIVHASIGGIVEAMRGCGRGCAFCLPNIRKARYIPIENIIKEVKVNLKYGITRVWLQSDDIFLYKLEDRRSFYPNRDAVLELFRSIMSVKGVRRCNPTHASIAPVVADPEMIKEASHILRGGPSNWIGVQPGLESGSGYLIKKYMSNKMKPFSPDEWQDVAVKATVIFNQNYWFPAYTLILGLPGETEDDAWDTVRLLDKLEKVVPKIVGKEKTHFIITPLSFVPLSALSGERMFDIDSEMNEARFCVIYRSWRIIVREIYRSLHSLMEQSPHLKLFLEGLIMASGELILKRIEKYGKKKGFRVERCFSCC